MTTARTPFTIAASLLSLLALGACATDAHRTSSGAPPTSRHAAADPGFLEQFAATNRFRLGKPASIRITPGGERVLFLRSGPRSFEQNLYEFDPATGRERVLLTAEGLLAGEEEELTLEELARRERMRQTARGVASFQMSRDGARLLVPLSGRLFVVDLATGASREIGAGEGFAIDARFSPDGSMVACVRDGDLYVIDVETGRERRLTTRESETITNGLAEFVAQEEMKRMEGYWWAPDGRSLAYTQVDVEGLETFHIADAFDPARPVQSWPYPRAGTDNAIVRLGVIGVEGGPTRWIEWDDAAYPYLATVRWTENAPLTLLVQNRHQTEQRLLAANPESGSVSTLLVERDSAWLNLDQDMPRWLADGSGFLWTSEREGEWRLELRGRDGDLLRPLTPLGVGYRRGLLSLDEAGRAAYVRASAEPTETHVYRVSLDAAPPRAERITSERGLHSAEFARDHSLRVEAHDHFDGGETWRVVRADGSEAGTLVSVAERAGFSVNVELTTTTGDEAAPRAAVFRPRDFRRGRTYPVILSVYGGPGVQVVTASRSGRNTLLNQWIADQGYIVVAIDGRGTPARGREWERVIRGDFIGVPLQDQADGLRALAARHPEMDLSRVGVYGWSFGGYFSAMAVMRMPELFHAGVAGAPVTDWIDYDTHYTERFIGLPQEEPEAYERSNVLTYAHELRRPLFIAHGTADDNVFFVHALKMSDALLREGIEHEFLPLAAQTHMVADPVYVRTLYERIMGFFERTLRRE
ncbi:MAG: S9 family peptidase [Phycisphaerales bacterium]|nr:MAG: S9 family peptidase [Phycisphaerales bacterium]